jgi:ABC-2 type transport system ATP-binding protein
LKYGKRAVVALLDDRTEQTLAMDDPGDVAKLADLMAGGRVLTMHSQEGTLEDVFVAMAGRPV